MDVPPGVACMDTRHPRRLLAPEQVLMRFSIIYDRPSASRIGECELAYNDAGKEEEVPTGHAKLDTLRPERVRDIPPPGFTDMPTTD
jgi:hypothetical protein